MVLEYCKKMKTFVFLKKEFTDTVRTTCNLLIVLNNVQYTSIHGHRQESAFSKTQYLFPNYLTLFHPVV